MQPFSAEYWHIGAITIRFARSSGPTQIGLKSAELLKMKLLRGGAAIYTRYLIYLLLLPKRTHRKAAPRLGALVSRREASGERLQAVLIDALE